MLGDDVLNDGKTSDLFLEKFHRGIDGKASKILECS
jgi:hypothetical protein